MTHGECIIRLSKIEEEYQKAKREVEIKYTQDKAAALNAWAKDNSQYQIGDIIESGSTTIVVEKILGNRAMCLNHIKFYCSYVGHALTKRLQPRKDEWVTNVHDDGGHIIRLIKKAKEE